MIFNSINSFIFFYPTTGSVLQTERCPTRANNFLLFQSKTQVADHYQRGVNIQGAHITNCFKKNIKILHKKLINSIVKITNNEINADENRSCI